MSLLRQPPPCVMPASGPYPIHYLTPGAGAAAGGGALRPAAIQTQAPPAKAASEGGVPQPAANASGSDVKRREMDEWTERFKTVDDKHFPARQSSSFSNSGFPASDC